MKVALFGGTFDPIHHGHLILARDAVEQLEAERMVFIPAAQSPHKLAREPAPAEVRLEMVRAAVEGEPAFEVDDAELHRAGPSFTIDTVEAWRERAPEAEFIYLIGYDNVRELHTWRRIEELRKLVQFVVFGRDSLPPDEVSGFPVLHRRIDISATEIRDRVARGDSIRYLVPEAVHAIIQARGLYRTNHPSTRKT